MAAVETMQRPSAESKRPTLLEMVAKPWRREPAANTLQASGGETVVYDKGKSQTTRKIVGETLVWGGGLYALWNVVTLDLSGVVAGGATHIAGRWVRPKKGQ